MGTITRDRGCCYYVPWLPSFCVTFVIAGLGVWAYFTNKCKGYTESGLVELDVRMDDLGRVQPALIATAIVYLVLAVAIFVASLWRSFIEASHDSLGETFPAALAYLVLNAMLNTAWWCLVVWVVFLIVADFIWYALVLVGTKAIEKTIEALATYGTASWTPSDNAVCPGQCLNLQIFSYVSSTVQDACICDVGKLAAAQSHFDNALQYLPAVQAGVWVLFAAGLCLLMNFACQFSHTKREREYLMRIFSNQFLAG